MLMCYVSFLFTRALAVGMKNDPECIPAFISALSNQMFSLDVNSRWGNSHSYRPILKL